MPVVFAGHVDHGKSTLVARTLLDTGYFPDGKLAELEAAAQRRGVPLEISFLLDAFQIERDQAITIDATRIWFQSGARRYEIIDAPGHREFVRHMVSGASDAVAAVLVVDAGEGIGEQTRRHALLLPLVGVTRAIVAVNKMDAVNFDLARFRAIESELQALFAQAGLTLVVAVPTVARDGDNVVHASSRMPWYTGPAILAALDALDDRPEAAMPLRFPVQDVYRRNEERILLGTVSGGRIEQGMTLLFSPSRETARVTQIVRFPASDVAAVAGEAIGLTLDRAIFVDPGDVASEIVDVPVVSTDFEATVFWLDATPLQRGEHLRMRCGTRDTTVVLDAVRSRIDVATFEPQASDTIERNDIGEVALRSVQPAVLDVAFPALGRFALYRTDAICGGGIVRKAAKHEESVRRRSPNVSNTEHGTHRNDRIRRNGHRGLVVWLTGLPSSGKSTLATQLESALFADGWLAYVLDGDTLRTGLNGDLGFSLVDRSENVRRTGEVAALFADAGTIAIVSLVSPHRAHRAGPPAAAPDRFHEVFVKADIATCETRDVKGLYRRARAGEIPDFTGVGSPYEEPIAAELVIDTTGETVAVSFASLLAYVRQAGRL
jgi:bifunctional enzyme CysN/CysC